MAAGRQRFSIISDGLPTQLPDIDPDETRDWVESFDSVVRTRGRSRARYVMLRLLERAREQQVGVPGLRSTDYINTIPPEREPWFPGDEYVERRIRAYIRWNAAVMVSRANRAGLGVGGHIATYASAATTSSAARITASRGTRSSSRATRRRASTPGRSSRAGSASTSWTASARNCPTRVAGCRPTRTRG